MSHPAPNRPTAMDDAPEPLAAPAAQCISVAFPTPIVMHDWPESDRLNAALQDFILKEARSDQGLVKSNVGGWHSAMDFLGRDAPPVRRLVTRIRTLMTGLIPEVMSQPKDGGRLQINIEGWANILHAGEYNTIHNHPNADWSGVYYVTGNLPSADDKARPFAGKLEFVDPRPGASLSYLDNSKLYGRCMLEPQAGRMALFPSWLQHFVHPCDGQGERISVAFNVTIRG